MNRKELAPAAGGWSRRERRRSRLSLSPPLSSAGRLRWRPADRGGSGLGREERGCVAGGCEHQLAPLAAELLDEGDLLVREAGGVLDESVGLGDALGLQLAQLGDGRLVASGLLGDGLLHGAGDLFDLRIELCHCLLLVCSGQWSPLVCGAT